MTPYWVSLALSAGLMLAAQRAGGDSGVLARDGRKYAMWGVVASAAVLVALTGFRYGVGQDYLYTYASYFQRVRLGYGQQRMEPGFYALNQAVAWLTDDPTPMFLACSVIFFGFTYAAIMRESTNPALSVFLLFGMSFVFTFMNAMRQMTAVAVLLFSLRFVEERRPVPFAACVAAATLFHSSAAVFAVAYLFPRLRLTPADCALAVLAVAVARAPIASAVNSVIERTQYAAYIGSVFDTGETGLVVIAMNLVVLLFSAAAPVAFGKGYEPRYRLLLWCQLVAACVAILSGAIPLSQRVRWVFSLPAVLLLPSAIDAVGDKRLRFLVQLCVVALYVAYIAITVGMWNANNVLPYRSVFDKGIV